MVSSQSLRGRTKRHTRRPNRYIDNDTQSEHSQAQQSVISQNNPWVTEDYNAILGIGNNNTTQIVESSGVISQNFHQIMNTSNDNELSQTVNQSQSTSSGVQNNQNRQNTTHEPDQVLAELRTIQEELGSHTQQTQENTTPNDHLYAREFSSQAVRTASQDTPRVQSIQGNNAITTEDLTADSRGVQERKRIKWGSMTDIDQISSMALKAHSIIARWNKNIFEVPTSKCGKDFLNEASRLVRLFNNRTELEPVAMNLLIIFFPLMLQKPARKSKNADHKRYLSKRLLWWKDGKLGDLLEEGETIQKRMKSSQRTSQEGVVRGFTRLMAEGKVRQALRLVDADNEIAGIHKLDENIRNQLLIKHPAGEDMNPGVISTIDPLTVQEVIFEEIGMDAI